MTKHFNNVDPIYGLDWTKMDGNILVVLQEDMTDEVVGFGTMTKRGLSYSLVCAHLGLAWRSSFFKGNPARIVQIRKDCDNDTLLFRIRLLFSDFEPFRLTGYQPGALIALAPITGNNLMMAVIQNYASKEILMVGVMNESAIRKTVETGLVTLWSRTRDRLWTKGETSGNFLRIGGFLMSPLSSSVVLLVDPVGPVCYTGTTTCFEESNGLIRQYRLGS